MRIKIIDLLIMIANDNAPKKFRYKRKIWKITDFDEVEYENNYTYFFKENLDCLITKHLNDEVEIVEEDELIELLDYEEITYYADGKQIETKKEVSKSKIVDKINEIIKKVNKMQK